MTIPWLANCPHSPDGWCLSCVVELGNASNDLLQGLEKVQDWNGTWVGECMERVGKALCCPIAPAPAKAERSDR